jgi:hypothetical protein
VSFPVSGLMASSAALRGHQRVQQFNGRAEILAKAQGYKTESERLARKRSPAPFAPGFKLRRGGAVTGAAPSIPRRMANW